MVNRLSVSETNVLRGKLGLRLIPDESGAKGTKMDINSVNDVARISIEETNKLRAQIGLRLIEATTVKDRNALEIDNYLKREEEIKQIHKVADLKKSVEIRKASMRRQKQMARGGILDREGESSSLEDWLANVQNSGDQESGSKKNGKSKLVNVSKKLKFKTASPKVTELEVLTLKDSEVLDDNHSGDELVNTEIEMDKKIQSNIAEKKLHSGELVSDIHRDNRLLGTDDSSAQIDGHSNTKKRTLVSIRFQSDDEDDDETKNINRDIAKPRFKKLKPNKNKKARSREENQDIEINFKPVSLIDQDEDQDDNGELERLLAATRVEKTKERHILETKDENTMLSEETMHENIQFLDTVHTLAVESKPDVKPLSYAKTNKNEQKLNSKLSERVDSILRNPQLDQSYSLSSILSHLNEKSDSDDKADPNSIKITYTDDKGNNLSTKEAYKFMSRKFHGTGKKKT